MLSSITGERTMTTDPTNPFTITSMDTVPNMSLLRRDGDYQEKRNLTAAQARRLLETWEFHKQRNIRPSRVTTYRRQMEEGDWNYRTEMHIGVLPDGTCYLLNGYHRLTALIQVETPGYTLPVRFIYTLMRDVQDIADYYMVMDIGGTRTSRDAIKAQGLAEEWAVSPDLLVAAGSASALILNNFAGSRGNSWHASLARSMPARLRFIQQWEAEIRMAYELLKPAPAGIKKLFLRQAVIGVMLMNLRHTPEQAVEFWTPAITGENLQVGMPALVLRNYLITTPTREAHEHIYARYVANCWNAFFKGESLTRSNVKTLNAVDLIVIEGTPFTRGRRDRERTLRLDAKHMQTPKKPVAPRTENNEE